MQIICQSGSGRIRTFNLTQLKGMGKVGSELADALIKENRGARASIKFEKIMYLYESIAFAKAIFVRCVEHPNLDNLFFQDEMAKLGDGLFPPMCFTCYEKAKHDEILAGNDPEVTRRLINDCGR
jgi:hypothetical protein